MIWAAAVALLLLGDLKVAPTQTAWAGPRGVDGSDADWATVTDAGVTAVAGSSVNVAVVVSAPDGGTEWVWRDAPRDERRSAANPDNPALDLTELRLTGNATGLYVLARFRRLDLGTTSLAQPLLEIAFDQDRGGGTGGRLFRSAPPGVTNVDSVELSSEFRYEALAAIGQVTADTAAVHVAVAASSPVYVFTANTKGDVAGDNAAGSQYAHWRDTDAADGADVGYLEAAIPWLALGGSSQFLGKSVAVAASVFRHKAATSGNLVDDRMVLGVFEAGASSMTDVMSPAANSFLTAEGPAGFAGAGTAGTWAEVRDGRLGFAASVAFDANGNPVVPPRPVLNPGRVRVDGVPVTGGGLAEVVVGRAPVFSWVLSSTGTPGTGAVRIQVGRDEASVTNGSPDVWDAGVSVSTADSTVTYGGPALQAGTTYYWHLLYVDAAGTSSGWSPTGRFLALGAAVPIAAGDDLIVDWNNPFNPLAGDVTKIRYVVRGEPKRVTLRIYSVTGGLVKTLEVERDAAPDAVQSVAWDGRNEEGQIVASGMYLAHMITLPEGTRITKKVVVVK